MKHLVCFVWPSTKGNHAGMSHMCDLLKKQWHSEFKVLKIYPQTNKIFLQLSFLNRVVRYGYRIIHQFIQDLKISSFYRNIKENDDVFLLEYLMPYCNQREIAIRIRELPFNVRIIGLAHLTPGALEYHFSKDEIADWATNVDLLMTLGSSLSAHFVSCNIPSKKIITGFHYVDNKYYFPNKVSKVNEILKIVFIGNVQRNHKLLSEIIYEINDVEFVIFSGGNKKIINDFEGYKHVTVKGYVSERELKRIMDKADVSLNIMDDTIGSNAITTSMAMGLALIVSDVGSIRDYCDENSALFCKSKADFIDSINRLKKDKQLLQNMKRTSYIQSGKLAIENYYKFLCSI